MPVFPSQKTVVIIAGPTAVGKTSLAISLAKHFNTEIISADSRQCYRELNIGVARPSPEELASIPHHFIADRSVQEEISAADYEQYALQKVHELFQQHDIVIMVGGTGLYIKAFCEGLDSIPAVPEALRSSIIENYEKHGITWLQNEIKENDPFFFEKGEIKNPQRMMRALEIIKATGVSILKHHTGEKKKRNFSIIKIGLELPREELQQRIDLRVDEMIKQGLVEEVKSVYAWRHMNALQTVGYKEIFDYLDNNVSLSKAIELIKIHTRQYAKRQMTWFKKDMEMHWFMHASSRQLIHFLEG